MKKLTIWFFVFSFIFISFFGYYYLFMRPLSITLNVNNLTSTHFKGYEMYLIRDKEEIRVSDSFDVKPGQNTQIKSKTQINTYGEGDLRLFYNKSYSASLGYIATNRGSHTINIEFRESNPIEQLPSGVCIYTFGKNKYEIELIWYKIDNQ